MKLEALTRPVSDDEVEWRISNGGQKADGEPWAMIVPYIQSRAAMNRLDEAFTPMGWTAHYEEITVGQMPAMQCTIVVSVDGESVAKMDVAAIESPRSTSFGDIDMAVKAAYSNAFKRAAVNWGIGRDLYSVKGAIFAIIHGKGQHYGSVKTDWGRLKFHWDAPPLELVRKGETADGSHIDPTEEHERDVRESLLDEIREYKDHDLVDEELREWCERALTAKNQQGKSRIWRTDELTNLIAQCRESVAQGAAKEESFLT